MATPTDPTDPTGLPDPTASADPTAAVSPSPPTRLPKLSPPATRPAEPPVPNPGGSGGPAATTLTGTVEAGVEPGCLLLDGHQLVGGPRDVLRAGARVTVTGQVQQDLMTTCQQGIPFLVASARAA
ncbi:hypothetical protein GCM10012279_05760 [Micromonospora yangpuensis]|uniref:Uncharacterized protein n=2 Tax=Micromonosporaceae TaxID=28056 RepID=A0A1C6U6H9_9ACTN|nr:hypothetical protein GCM10012279_05760 [Micromonospora yangpuensis]SCL49627.1 hypothetical protein GA0070617_1240 [Micromonospora yangpuensis]